MKHLLAQMKHLVENNIDFEFKTTSELIRHEMFSYLTFITSLNDGNATMDVRNAMKMSIQLVYTDNKFYRAMDKFYKDIPPGKYKHYYIVPPSEDELWAHNLDQRDNGGNLQLRNFCKSGGNN